jgi:hypothetical protein
MQKGEEVMNLKITENPYLCTRFRDSDVIKNFYQKLEKTKQALTKPSKHT